MSAVLVAFPCERLAGKIRRAADVVERSAARLQSAYRERVLADLARQMQWQGIRAEEVARQVSAFDRALDAELCGRWRSRHHRPGGEAA